MNKVFISLRSEVETRFQAVLKICSQAGIEDRSLTLLLKREREGNTFIGSRTALPHAVAPGSGEILVYAKLRKPVQWGGKRSETADFIFLIVAPSRAEVKRIMADTAFKIIKKGPDLTKKIFLEEF